MSDMAVTEVYFDEPVDEEIAHGPDCRKSPHSGERFLESGVLCDNSTELLIANEQSVPGAISTDLLD